MKAIWHLAALFFLVGCQSEKENRVFDMWSDVSGIEGNQDYLDSPFLTAGNRTYLIGHQDGSFPEIGWHIKGEMGGLWNHPIKLLDGFSANLEVRDKMIELEKASKFVNYPFDNTHYFEDQGTGISVQRTQFIPDDLEGLILTYKLRNASETATEINFNFTAHIDLRPAWLGEQTQMIDYPDTLIWDATSTYFLAEDTGNPWYVSIASDHDVEGHSKTKSSYQGLGVSGKMHLNLKIEPHSSEEIQFFIAGSYTEKTAVLKTLQILKDRQTELFQAKKERYAQLSRHSRLSIPDTTIQKAFEWLKYNCDWLVQEVPEIGTGITAGIPDYPWWFGVDSEYALQGYLAIGQFDAALSTIKLLDSVSEAVNGNGRIIHEMSTNGAVFNKGNINETPQFATLILETYNWTGDQNVLKDYFPTIQKGLHWLMQENDANKNLFPDGFGMMEIHGLDSEMIDVAAYTQKGFADASEIAAILGNNALSETYAQQAAQLKDKINEEFWSEQYQSYADFIGTDEQAIRLIEDAIIRADTLNKPWAVKELEATKKFVLNNPSREARPFVLHHNWVVNTPMEVGIAEAQQAQKALKTAETFVNPFGVFVTGIDRDEASETENGSFKGSKSFSYVGAVMTLPTGVQAVAENNYGNPDKALEYIKRMTRSFSYAFPGSMYEVSPDYGMITQAWTIYGYAIPIVKQFFGINPKAGSHEIFVTPQMPAGWNDVAIENVKIGTNDFSMYYQKNTESLNLKLVQTQADYKIHIQLAGKATQTLEVIEGDISHTFNSESNQFEIDASGTNIHFTITD